MRTTRVRRGVATLLLVSYGLLLLLSSWQPEVRPRFLDGASMLATRWLACAGIYPGLPVFSDPSPDPSHPTAKDHAFVVQVVATDVDGTTAPLRVWPYDRPPTGFRFLVPVEEMVLLQALLRLASEYRATGQDQRGPAAHQGETRCARAIGHHVEQVARSEGREIRSFLLRWTVHRVDLASREEGSFEHLLFEWNDGKPPTVQLHWFPGRAEVDRRMAAGR